MEIKSDAAPDFEQEKPEVAKKQNKKNDFIWLIILCFGAGLMWVALMSPEVSGIVAFIVFFIGLHRVDAAIDYYRGIDDGKSISVKDMV